MHASSSFSPPDLHALVQRHGGRVFDGGRSARLPGPGHSRHDDSLSLTIASDGRLLVKSFSGDDPADLADHLGLPRSFFGEPRERPISKAASRSRQRPSPIAADRADAFCRAVWSGTQDASGSIVETYLRSRAIRSPIPAALRFHPAAPLGYESRSQAPSMVALVTDAAGRPCGLHVTALRPDGSGKARGDASRRMFGAISGAAVRLGTMDSGALAVSEGIETALAFRDLTSAGVWSCLSTAGLAAFEPPPGLRDLTVAADGDAPGLKAALTLAERLSPVCPCHVLSAPDGLDWNDVLEGCA